MGFLQLRLKLKHFKLVEPLDAQMLFSQNWDHLIGVILKIILQLILKIQSLKTTELYIKDSTIRMVKKVDRECRLGLMVQYTKAIG